MNFKHGLLAATLLLGTAGAALAQPGPTYDPAQLPEVKGNVANYLLTPRGDVDGLMLADGTEVHVPPHLSTQLVYSVKPGDAVTIHGLKAKASPMVIAGSVTNDGSGVTVQGGWRGPRGGVMGGAQIEATGTVKAALHTPRGEIDGVLLQDGTIVRLPPPEAQKFAADLAVGKSVYVRGFGTESPLGKVVAAQSLGADKDHTQQVAGPRAGGWGAMHERMMGRGAGPEGHGPVGGPPVH